jgi:4,5-dihydroxyphthalate decarboxylase
MAEPLRLRTVLGDHPYTAALKSGDLTSPGVTLDFVPVEPIHKAFAPMVRHQDYDLSELAIVTALQAIAYDKPIVMLPAVVASRLQRGCLIYHRPQGVLDPQSLAGRRIGVRAYTQTTGMWVRAALFEDYGLTVDSVQWITRDGAHVAEYVDPPFVRHSDSDKSLLDQLRDGDIDAAILGNDLPKDPEFAPVIPNHRAVDLAWYKRHGFMPINHVVAVRRDLVEAQPGAIRAAYNLLHRSATEAGRPADSPDPTLFGIEALREPIAFIVEECLRQGLLPRALSVDEVLGPAESLLREPQDAI